MKILVYGAGVIGCNLAHQLFIAQKNVTLLARNEWYKTLQTHGLHIKNQLTKRDFIEPIPVVDSLADEYDVIFVTMQNSQVKGIFESLANCSCKNIIFIGNNINTYEYLIKGKNVLFGFYHAAGRRDGSKVYSFDMRKITVGRIDGLEQSNDFINSIFKGTKIKVTICNKMDDFLKSHAAFILPLAFASYHYNNSLKPLRKNGDYIELMVQATLEMYDVLIADGYEILPEGDYEFSKRRKPYIRFVKAMAYLPVLANMCICEHAKAGKDEMLYLAKEFQKKLEVKHMKEEAFDKIFGFELNK